MTTSALDRDDQLIRLLEGKLRHHDDQTVYLRAKKVPSQTSAEDVFDPTPFNQKKVDNPKSLDFSISAKSKSSGKSSEIRVQASKCFRGEGWSLTLRGADALVKASSRRSRKVTRGTHSVAGDWMKTAHKSLGGYAPAANHVFSKITEVTVASYQEIGDSILEMISESPSDRLKGLLFITGETKCGKSYIARGLIHTYLANRAMTEIDRNPHLVTYEDPIEKGFYSFEELMSQEMFRGENRKIDYTPRQKDVDCDRFSDCTRDALRQTPSVLFAGEIRSPEDLAEAVSFGGTGHFIVATGHAGSLVEAAEKIFSATQISNSIQRAAHVPKVLGIVHLKAMKANCIADGALLESSVVIPSIYRRCSSGLQDLVSEGLASILPYCPVADEDGVKFGSLGRQFMVRKILKKNKRQPSISDKCQEEWTRAELKGTSQQKRWETYWPSIRKFHAGPAKVGRIGPDPDSGPLWMLCAEDDLNGLA